MIERLATIDNTLTRLLNFSIITDNYTISTIFSEKKHESYAETNYIRTKISFALLRSAILCIRGCRSLRKTQFIDNSISAVVEEGRLK